MTPRVFSSQDLKNPTLIRAIEDEYDRPLPRSMTKEACMSWYASRDWLRESGFRRDPSDPEWTWVKGFRPGDLTHAKTIRIEDQTRIEFKVTRTELTTIP